ncbi:MAG: Hpt domain-containing protein [Plesiomonas sp.]|uniref:Hpt domain-containing protein n=1 Tax=Plesiomonas sp. TaxID=2486279 RepID=UPI003F2EF288
MAQLQALKASSIERLDLQVLNELQQEIGDDVLVDIIQVYLIELDEHIIQMTDAHNVGDFIALGKLAHCIKSSSGSLGAKDLYHAALRLEMHCRNTEIDASELAYVDFMQYSEPTKAALQDYLAS